jgi:caa(3)-type oxidase subunit IV
VALSYSKRSLEAAITGAMTIATIKACLVGGYFMHLIKERPIIFALLILAFILLVFILALPVVGLLNGVSTKTGLFS